MAIALGLPGAAGAQGVRVTGRVVRVTGPDSLPVAGAWVTLHRVTAREGGLVDSARSDPRGRYAVRAAAPDTTALYVVSVMHHGIAYFTRPVHSLGRRVDTADVLTVFDTSSVAPPVTTAQRHIVVRQASADGSRRVVELIVLSNAGYLTRIAQDTSRPVWQGALPRGAFQLEVGESDVSSEAITVRDGRLAVSAPIPPGEKQVVVSYLLPGAVSEVDLVADEPVPRLNVLVEDSAATVVSGQLMPLGFEQMEGVSFARFDGAVTEPGARIRVSFARRGVSPGSLWWLIVVLTGVAFVVAFVLRAQRPATQRELTDSVALAAQLDAVNAALAADPPLPEAERAAYQRHRAMLEQRLAGGRDQLQA